MKLDIARAWKDEAYRDSLSASELAQVPAHPAGAFELTEEELDSVSGAWLGNNNNENTNGSHARSEQFTSAFFICLNTTILAVCINEN